MVLARRCAQHHEWLSPPTLWAWQTSGTGTSTSYTYDANGNRLTQTETKGASNKTTSCRWNAQDQLVRVEQGIGTGASLQTLASYRYNADNLRAEKSLTDNGIANATQGSTAIGDPLAYERIQWDGLHARRSFEISGANNNTQTLRSDTDAAVLQGNTAPWLVNRTNYANGVGSASSTTQLLADSNGNLTATVVNDAGAAKADSLLVYSAYGAVDTEASGNAGTGLRSNANTFGSYYADPETGLLYARARYFDPASRQFISRDPQEGDPSLPITWGAYQYGAYNPYRYTDPNGQQTSMNGFCGGASECPDSGEVTYDSVVGGGRSGWKTVKGVVRFVGDVIQHLGDVMRAGRGDPEALKRVHEDIDKTISVARELPNLPAHMEHHRKEVFAEIDRLRKNGDEHAANQLAAEFAADVAQMAWGATGIVKGSVVGLSKVARSGGAVEGAIAPVVAAKTGSRGATATLLEANTVTPQIVVESSGLQTAAKIQVNNKSAPLLLNSAAEEFVTFSHGSSPGNVANIRKNGISLSESKGNNDFGSGFYMAESSGEAIESAKMMSKNSQEFVEFRVPKSELAKLNSKVFTEASPEWVDFVTMNKKLDTAKYIPPNEWSYTFDMVSGPMFGGVGRNGVYTLRNRGMQTSIHTQEAVDLFNKYMVK